MALHIDGTTRQGDLLGNGGSAPYAIFDDERQDWLRTGIRWHWLACLLRVFYQLKE